MKSCLNSVRPSSHHVVPHVVAAAVLIGLGTSGTMRADVGGWPEFRGPSGQGLTTAKGLPVRFDPAKDATWRQPIPGKGWSSPILHGGRVYMTTAVEASPSRGGPISLRTVCLDAKSGKEIWNVEVFQHDPSLNSSVHKKNSHASPTPLTDGERLYVHFGVDGTAALDFNGQVIWSNQSIRFDPRHGCGGSPVLSGSLLIFNCDGVDDPFVVALRRNTGEVAWKASRPATESQRFSFATPLEIDVQGAKQIVSPASHMVCSYDPVTGKELWRVHYPDKWSIIPRPVFAHGLVYVCTGYVGPAELLAIRPDGQGDVTKTHVVWRTKENVPHSPSPIVVGDDIYLMSDDGIASCRDARSGKMHWRQRVGGNYSASPLYADGKIYWQSEEGACTVIGADRKFKEVAKNVFDEQTLASYAVDDGALFIRTESSLYRFD